MVLRLACSQAECDLLSALPMMLVQRLPNIDFSTVRHIILDMPRSDPGKIVPLSVYVADDVEALSIQSTTPPEDRMTYAAWLLDTAIAAAREAK